MQIYPGFTRTVKLTGNHLPDRPVNVNLVHMDDIFQSDRAELYERWLETPAGSAYLEATCALIDRVLDCRRGWRVLDVGCGAGVHLDHLAQRGMLLNGVDAGPVMATAASRRLGSKADIEVADAYDLPYEDNTFDAVIMVNTLELLDRPGQALAEAARVAGSRVCLISLNRLSLGWWFCRLSGPDHPYNCARLLPIWAMLRRVREVLGPVPVNWAGATYWPGLRPRVGRRPFGGLVGVAAAVTPRYGTRPLSVSAPSRQRSAQPLAGAGQVTWLRRIK